jgi:hypothetical protein
LRMAITSGREVTCLPSCLLSVRCFNMNSDALSGRQPSKMPDRNPFHRISPLVNQIQQVFWLSDQPSCDTFPVEWSPPVAGFRLVTDVPDYSGGTATESHRVPGYWIKPFKIYGYRLSRSEKTSLRFGSA